MDMKSRYSLGCELNWARYWEDLEAELSDIESRGVDVSQLKRNFFQAKAANAEKVNDQLITKPQRIEASAQVLAVRNEVSASVLMFPEVAKGDMLGFSDIASAAEFYENFTRVVMQGRDNQNSYEHSKIANRAYQYCLDIKQDREAGLRHFVNLLWKIERGNYKRVAVASANTIASVAIRFLTDKVVAVVDSNNALTGQLYEGVEVHHISELPDLETDLVLIAKPYAYELIETVRQCNQARENPYEIVVIE